MFDILTGVRQGCILSPFLFLIVIDFVMKKTVNGRDYGITWGSEKLADLDFADDLALLCNTQEELQEMTNSLQCNAAKVGLCINTKKTKAMIVGNNTVPALTVNGTDIKHVDNFQYLGSYMSNDGDVTYDMCTRIGKASSVFRRLRPIWRSSTISKNTKLRLYTSDVIPTAIYAGDLEDNGENTAHVGRLQ